MFNAFWVTMHGLAILSQDSLGGRVAGLLLLCLGIPSLLAVGLYLLFACVAWKTGIKEENDGWLPKTMAHINELDLYSPLVTQRVEDLEFWALFPPAMFRQETHSYVGIFGRFHHALRCPIRQDWWVGRKWQCNTSVVICLGGAVLRLLSHPALYNSPGVYEFADALDPLGLLFDALGTVFFLQTVTHIILSIAVAPFDKASLPAGYKDGKSMDATEISTGETAEARDEIFCANSMSILRSLPMQAFGSFWLMCLAAEQLNVGSASPSHHAAAALLLAVSVLLSLPFLACNIIAVWVLRFKTDCPHVPYLGALSGGTVEPVHDVELAWWSSVALQAKVLRTFAFKVQDSSSANPLRPTYHLRGSDCGVVGGGPILRFLVAPALVLNLVFFIAMPVVMAIGHQDYGTSAGVLVATLAYVILWVNIGCGIVRTYRSSVSGSQ
jgi:hypothetical protein